MYELQSHPGCFQPYSGRRRAETVFVVGLGTEHEQIFQRKDNRAAIAHAKTTKGQLAQIHVTQICYEAAAELFGEPI